MSAGTGILHSEKNDAWRLRSDAPRDEPIHFIQMWVVPDEQGIRPDYEQADIADERLRGGLVPVASAMDHHADSVAIRIRNRFAHSTPARLGPGETVAVPDATYAQLFVARGGVDLEGAANLADGDTVRFTATGGQRVTAHEPSEVLVWEMHAGLA